MLSEKDVGKPVRGDYNGARGIVTATPDGLRVRVTLPAAALPVGFIAPADGWTLDDPGTAPWSKVEIGGHQIPPAPRVGCAVIEEIADHLEDEATEHPDGSEWRRCLSWVAGQIRSGEIPGVDPPGERGASEPPWVECSGCGRKVQCVRVKDGTVYRPFAWVFGSEAHPLAGLCGGCQPAPIERGKLAGFGIERAEGPGVTPEILRCDADACEAVGQEYLARKFRAAAQEIERSRSCRIAACLTFPTLRRTSMPEPNGSAQTCSASPPARSTSRTRVGGACCSPRRRTLRARAASPTPPRWPVADPIPTDTPTRRAFREMHPDPSDEFRRLSLSTDEDDIGSLASWVKAARNARLTPEQSRVLAALDTELDADLASRGLSVSSRGKVIRIVDDAERERRLAAVTEAAPCNERAAWAALEATEDQLEERDRLRLAAGPDPDARHDDHERGER